MVKLLNYGLIANTNTLSNLYKQRSHIFEQFIEWSARSCHLHQHRKATNALLGLVVLCLCHTRSIWASLYNRLHKNYLQMPFSHPPLWVQLVFVPIVSNRGQNCICGPQWKNWCKLPVNDTSDNRGVWGWHEDIAGVEISMKQCRSTPTLREWEEWVLTCAGQYWQEFGQAQRRLEESWSNPHQDAFLHTTGQRADDPSHSLAIVPLGQLWQDEERAAWPLARALCQRVVNGDGGM